MSTPIRLLVLLLLLVAVVEAQKPSDSSSNDGDAWEGDANVSPSMATVVIVLVLGFFITGCIYIYIQHCVAASSSTDATAGMHANSNAIRGLDQSVIDTFPVFQYSAVKELKIGKGALECAVCLSEFQEDETLRFLPKCQHVFHSECIDSWLVGHATCPVCRDNLVAATDSDAKLGGSTESISTTEVQITIPGDEETTALPNKKGRYQLPRSHSTGHSLTQAGENCERFTLRLPVEVRRQLLARTKLKRATSLVALPRQSSSRRGYRGGGGGEGSGSSRYGRFFGRSFMQRVASFRTTAKVGVEGDSTTGSIVEKRCSAAVVSPMDQSFPPPLPV